MSQGIRHSTYRGPTKWSTTRRNIAKNWQLYIFILPAFLYFLIFAYFPMYGIVMAFKDFSPKLGVLASPWADPFYKYFKQFVSSWNFWPIFKNTITISLYSLLASFPVPILLALMLNEVKMLRFKKLVQNITYAPHFISVVVLVGMVQLIFGLNGIVNIVIERLGGSAVNFLQDPAVFKHMYVWSGIWQGAGYGSIIYLAALAGVPHELHEAAVIDGASRLRRIWNVNLPYILPTIVILMIMNTGSIMNVGFEKVFLMQNDVIQQASEVISTYVYRQGILNRSYSLSAAVGLFNNIINLTLLILVNKVSKKLTDTSLW